MVKKFDKFNFDKEIYLDRFLEKNKKEYLKVREIVKKLKSEAKLFEEALIKIKNYKNSNINLQDILGLTMQFFSE